LTIQSINTTTGAITFVENTTAETNAQFMFVHTLSPLVSGNVEPLYSYPTCSIYLDANDNQSNSGARLMVAKITFASGVPTNISIEDSVDVPNWVDTLGFRQVETNHLSPRCVTTEKIEYHTVDRSKLKDNAFGYRGMLFDRQEQDEILYVEPGTIITDYYNNDNPGNHRYIEPSIPTGYTLENCVLQPARVIMSENAGAGTTYEVMNYFQSNAGINFVFDASVEGVIPDNEHKCMFEFYWLSLTQVLVKFTYLSMNI